MAKILDPLQKCIIANQINQEFNSAPIISGEKITIVIETKKNGDLKNLTITKGEATK